MQMDLMLIHLLFYREFEWRCLAANRQKHSHWHTDLT